MHCNGFADDPAEAEKVLNEMDLIMNDTGVVAKDIARAIEADRVCQEELKALDAKLAAARWITLGLIESIKTQIT